MIFLSFKSACSSPQTRHIFDDIKSTTFPIPQLRQKGRRYEFCSPDALAILLQRPMLLADILFHFLYDVCYIYPSPCRQPFLFSRNTRMRIGFFYKCAPLIYVALTISACYAAAYRFRCLRYSSVTVSCHRSATQHDDIATTAKQHWRAIIFSFCRLRQDITMSRRFHIYRAAISP